MPENNKDEEFLQKIASCIERGDFEACVDETVQLAKEIGMDAPKLYDLSGQTFTDRKYEFAYVLALAAAQSLSGLQKGNAYFNAAVSAQYIEKMEETSEEYYKKAIKLNTNRAQAYGNYANLLYGLDRKEEAEKLYRKAIELDDNYYRANYNYALLLTELGREDEAEEYLKKATKIKPEFTDAHIYYANILRKKLQLLEAEREIRIAIQNDSENPYVYGILGDILSDEGLDFKEAKEAYDKALKYSASMEISSLSEIHNNLGWVYRQLKQDSKAKDEFQIAIKLDTLNVKARHNYRALSKIGLAVELELSNTQKYIAAVLSLAIIVLFILFSVNRLSETVLATQSTILIAFLIFILLFNQITKFKVGEIEFEKSTEQRSQYIEEKLAKIER
jgi:Tfp pilus assembly protein PilF